MRFGSPLVVAGLVLWQVGGGALETSHPGYERYERYERTVMVAGTGAACAVLDGSVFAHAGSALRDVRLTRDGAEAPYAITVSEAAQAEAETARVVALREQAGGAEVTLEMPQRAYTEVVLDLAGRDFVAQATVSGAKEAKDAVWAVLGTYTLFDMTAKGLARSTTIALQETSFRFLKVELRGRGFAVRGAVVPPSREAQTVYTPVAQTGDLSRRGTETVARFRLGARVPVERVSIGIDPGYTGNFSRRVRVTAKADAPGSMTETLDGTIVRVRMGSIQMEQMTFPASLGANLQGDATVEVAVEDGREPPLKVSRVALEMRERRICFDAGQNMELFYGDAELLAPDYEAGNALGGEVRTGAARNAPLMAVLGPEKAHAGYRPRVDERTFLARNPEVPWVLLLGSLALAGLVALRPVRR